MSDIFSLSNLIGALINSFAYIFIWSKLFEMKINFKNIRFYLFHILLTILMMINYLFVADFIRIIIQITFMSIVAKTIYNQKYIYSLLASFISQIIIMIAELIFVGIIIIITNNATFVLDSFGKTIIANIIISLLAMLISKIKFIRIIYKKGTNLLSRIDKRVFIFIIMLILISTNFVFLRMYHEYNLTSVLIINILISVLYMFICAKIIFTENKYNKVNEKYNTTLNSLKEYESMLDKYRIFNHENKNQLLTIRNMLPKTNKKVISYIDTILDNKLKDDNKILKEVTKIPAGGLRGIIYSKILLMEELNIKYELFISNEVKTVELIDKIDDNTMLDVCKIIGVYLDNSIQAVEKLKNKNVSIELYIEDSNLNIKISNNYKGNIDISKLEDKGYTTKEKGHGYGLSLTKELIDNNSNLSNEKEINKKIFSQILKIKM